MKLGNWFSISFHDKLISLYIHPWVVVAISIIAVVLWERRR